MGLDARAMCHSKGCRNTATRAGYCPKHHSALYKATSYGVLTGRTPKLTESDCKEIRKLHSQFKTQHSIALLFGVNPGVISKVIAKKYNPAPDES